MPMREFSRPRVRMELWHKFRRGLGRRSRVPSLFQRIPRGTIRLNTNKEDTQMKFKVIHTSTGMPDKLNDYDEVNFRTLQDLIKWVEKQKEKLSYTHRGKYKQAKTLARQKTQFSISGILKSTMTIMDRRNLNDKN